MWGVPVERRWAFRMEEARDEVEPLPFVPAMWRGLRRVRSAGCWVLEGGCYAGIDRGRG